MSAATSLPRHICRHVHLRPCAVLLLVLFCCVSARAQDDSVLTGDTICLDGSGGITTAGTLSLGGATMSLVCLHAPISSTFFTITNDSLIYTNTLNYSTNNNFLIVPGGIYGSTSLFTNGSVGLVTISGLGGSTMSVTNIWISGSTLSVSSSFITGNLVYTNLLLLNSTNRTFSTLIIPTLNLGGGILTNVASSSIINVQNGTLSINSGTTFASRLYVTNGADGILNFNAGLLTSFGSIVSNGLSLRIGNGTNAASLVLPSGSHTFADGLTIAANASLSNASSLNSSNMVIAASGQFTMSEGFAVVNIVTNSGIFIQSGGIFDPAFYHNTGTLQLTGGTNQDTVFLNDVGAIVQHSGGQLDVSVATNFGSWTVSGTAVANLTNFINGSGATLSITGGTFNTSQLTATNAGNILYFSAGHLHSGGSAVSNGVAFTVGNGVKSATLNLLGGTHSFANGLFINTNSWLTGTGAIAGVITNAGTIAPGDSPGILTISGDLTLLNNSRLLMELAGTNNGLYDQINLDGTVAFGGTLTLSLLDGFTVNLGDRFDLFDFSSSSGSFSQFNLPTLSPLLYWDTSALYSSGEIEADAVPPGVIAWGYNSDGQTNVPVGLTAVAAISAGEGYNMALKSDGTVVAWGGNGNGATNVPVGLSGVMAISAASHNMALKNNGTVVAWGYNNHGQTNVPTGLSNVVAIAAGTLHSMVIRSDGTVFAWGDNSDGKTNVPTGLSGVVAIAGSQWHSMALKSNGTVIAWGSNSYGQTNVPTGLSNVVAIAAGPYHNMALKSNGTVVAWGNNGYGQTNVPTGLSNVVAIAAASQHSAVLKSDGTIVAWGSNSYGQTNMPEGLRGVVAMGARGLNTMVLRPYGPAVTPNDLVLPSGVRGTIYNHPLQATGGTAPYSWTVTSGRLPAGLTLDSSGTISGTPMASGLSCFRVRVTGADGLATDKDLVLKICQAPTITTGSTLPPGAVSVAYSQALAVADGATPYTWSLSAGSLPSGLSLSSAGVISGTPDIMATASFTIQVTGSDGFSSTKNFSLMIHPPPTTTVIDGIAVNDFGTYMVGTNSGLNALIITNGGVLTSSGGVIGNSAIASANSALVTGPGSLWNNGGSLYVGNTGCVNTLTLTNGGTVSATNIVVGFDSSSIDNIITVSGGHLRATNADGGGVLEVRYSALTFNSGTVTVDRLLLTNGANSVFNFNGGTLNSGGSALNNNSIFRVGDGTSAATLHLLGGTHSFANGLFINTNSWLTGTGAITGVITNAGSIAPGDSPGVLTGSSNLTLLSSSLLLMKLAGTNSGLYDQINLDGTLTFGGTLTLSLLDGFAVSMGDQFDLFDFSSSSGSFSQFNLPTLSPLLYWDTSQLYTSGEIEADWVPPGVIVWGDNSTSQTNVPVGLTAVAAVSAGEGHNMALRSDGTVVAWGGNDVGQTNVPAGLSGVAAISAGNHSMALRCDGTVVAWGRNAEGQTNVPVGLSGVVAIAAGTHHCMAIRSDGTVVAWGDNSDGKTNVPAGLSGVVSIAGSQWHSLALKSNGTVIAWGTSSYGLTSVPAGLSNVVAIAAGPYHNMALRNNGTVVAWGTGLDTVPTGLSNVVAIAAASQHSAALKSDGTVVVWGSNSYGQTNMPAGLCGVAAMGARGLNTMVLRPYGPVVTPSDLMLPSGVRGTIYNHPLQATGGTAPYSWTITSGRLPAGLTLDSNGTISGTPTASGLSCFRVRVTGADGLATDKDLAIQMAPDTTPLTLLAAVSRKTHGAAGTFDVSLNLNPTVNPTVEPRKNGPTQLLFTFNQEMMTVDGTLDASEFTLTNATYVSASILSSNLTLNLTNAMDQSKVTVVLNGFSDLDGNALAGTNAVRIRSLYGDANQSGTANIADMQVIKFKLGSALSATNFLYDINLSGVINIADMQVAKTMLSHTVPLNSVGSGANSLVTLQGTALSAAADASVSSMTLGKALGAPELVWSTDGDAVWTATIALDGSLMAWSGSIGHLNVSWVETTVTGPGTLSFQWKVSSEADADYLTFSIDGVDQQGRLSGEVDWQTLTFSIPSGTHRLTWTYAKNGASAAGLDAGWLRKIVYQRNP